MSGKGNLTTPSDIVYVYDGSFAGFLCCVHESVYSRCIPSAIFCETDMQPTLYTTLEIQTDPQKADRVQASFRKKISARAEEIVETVFLSCLAEKELCLLRFLLLGYQLGAKVPDMIGHPDVAPVLAAERHLLGENHLLLGFVRFSDFGGVLASTITPKNFVLPFMTKHFTTRFSEEDFIIYDKTHKAALVYQDHMHKIIPLEELQLPEPSEKEEAYRSLWKQFYKTIAIEARYNPKCRMTHMPKRYWANMTEMQELL
ncbi:MAG: TIGR03915 family putative DNA repair protein [Oscillospiraceae bacterium]